MNNIIVELVGYVSAVLTTAAYIPQALRTIRTKKTHDISLNMYILMFTGVSGWLAYGFFLKSIPMLIANSITLCLIFTIIILKIKYK